MSLRTVQRVSKAGILDLAAALTAADTDPAGDSVNSAPGLLVVVANNSAGARVVTVAAPAPPSTETDRYGSLDIDPITLNIPAGATALLAIPPGYADNGVFTWTYDDPADTTVGVFAINA